VAAAAEKLAQGAFDTVPRHRVAHLATDGDTQPGLPTVIFSADGNEMGGVNFPAGS